MSLKHKESSFNNTQKFASKNGDAFEVFGDGSKTEAQTDTSPELAWQRIQDKVAENAGLAVLLVDGPQPPSLAVSNNNSVCQVLQSSNAHAHLCEPFRGKAFEHAQKAGDTISYHCHAGLYCVVPPLEPNVIRPLGAIVGRAFTKVTDYEILLDRLRTSDWQDLPDSEVCRNLLFAESEAEVAEVASGFRELDERKTKTLLEFVARTEPNPYSSSNADKTEAATQNTLIAEESNVKVEKQSLTIVAYRRQNSNAALPTNGFAIAAKTIVDVRTPETLEDFAAWQLFADSLLEKSFKAACAETLRFLAARFGLESLAWLERSQQTLRLFLADEYLRSLLNANFELAADDALLRAAALDENSYKPKNLTAVEIFPLSVGDDIRAAIAVGDKVIDDERRRRIAKFCRQIAVSLEVLRLREELARRAEIVRAIQLFNEKLNVTTDETLFDSMLETSVELLRATRGSLLVFNEAEQKLQVVAAVGTHSAEVKKQIKADIGERIAQRVFSEGKPIVIEDVSNYNLPPAPPERDYKSNSFICFPLRTGSRTVGMLNMTDKSDGTNYNQNDLDLLEAIAPQLAIVLDRAQFQQRAGMFEQLSITDALTGLLNRRYLNERLSEEVNRSNRDGSPMSFMMIDIDNFKSYNDRFGHQAGDEVLRTTAQCLKAVLRSADVAARYGGEEFSLLLPQTTLSEARLIGERIRERVEKTDFPQNRLITISVGIAGYSPFHNTPDEIIEAADKALYQAKRIGKNNVQLWLFGQTRR